MNKLTNGQFKVLSYNICFDEYQRTERLFSLVDTINRESADVVCLQEVLDFQYDTIRDRLNYDYSYPENLDTRYGCVILSKYPIVKSKTINLPTKMGRSLLLAQIEINDIPVVIANTHFESEFREINDLKLEQFEHVSTILDKLYNDYKNIILCSDTNVTDYDKNNFDSAFGHMSDSWIINGSNKQKEFTYDFTNNSILQARNIKLRCRIDRILFRCDNNVTLNDFNLIKEENNKYQPSDHHGISSLFNLCIVNNN